MMTMPFAMRAPSQLPLPLCAPDQFSRDDLIVVSGNAQAVAFIDAWPDWPVAAVALHGPRGCGKTHLATIWRRAANAGSVSAARIAEEGAPDVGAFVIEDVDAAECSQVRDAALFAALERASTAAPCLLTGRAHPASWPVSLPDLGSRFAAVPALPLWTPDEALLSALARKLFSDRQLLVPDSVIQEILRRLDRCPGSIRDFVAELDATALGSAKPVSVALVRSLIAERSVAP
jgi:chromosomal replication initiation ATPase DnaA